MIITNLEGERFFINIQPIDNWESWWYEIYAEDIISPFYVIYRTPNDVEFKSYDSALIDAIKRLDS